MQIPKILLHSKPEQIKLDPAIKPLGFKKILKIALLFIGGLISTAVFGIAFLIMVCVPLANLYAQGWQETYCEGVNKLVGPVLSPFAALFGIWVVLKLMNKKTNYSYLITLSAIFAVIKFFISNVFLKENISQFNEFCSLGVPLILAIVANEFSSKQMK